MTRNEYNTFRYIRSYKTKGFKLTYGTTLTIPMDASKDYKARLHELYTSWGFHPCTIRSDKPMWGDDRLRIIYIYGLTWDLHGEEKPWSNLYTKDELSAFQAALEQ